ncbi:MAG: hypothetical protein MAG453_00206 [Calditrichaeota bacterium]|nr:hypothetical protein [Calditrichota bacterium]
MLAGAFADISPLNVRREFGEQGRIDERIDEHDVSAVQNPPAAHGDQVRVTGTRADEIDHAARAIAGGCGVGVVHW